MPAQKGRKRRQERERRRGEGGGTATATNAGTASVAAPRESRRAKNDGPLPSTTARATGFMIAIITAILAILMVYQSVSRDPSSIDGVARIIGGSVMVLLAVIVGVLSVAPGQVRDWFARRR